MKINLKNPEKQAFLSTLWLWLFCWVGMLLFVTAVYHAFTQRPISEVLHDFCIDFLFEEPLLALIVLVCILLMGSGIIRLPRKLHRNYRQWKTTRRINRLEFTRNGVYLIGDGKIFLPYERTSLLVKVTLITESRHRAAPQVKIRQADLLFSSEDFSYLAGIDYPSPQTLYRLAAFHQRFMLLSFDIPHAEPADEENTCMACLLGLFFEEDKNSLEKQFGSHLAAQVNNQMRFGKHCKYTPNKRFRILTAAVIFFIFGLTIYAKMPFPYHILDISFFTFSAALFFLWTKDTLLARKLKYLNARQRLCNVLLMRITQLENN